MRSRVMFVLPCVLFGAICGATNADPKPAPKTPLANVGIDKLLARMTDAKASFEARAEAEDELAKRPAKDVLPKLLPVIAKGMPEGGIYNSLGTREFERKAPIAWQIYYAGWRAWRQQLDSVPRKEAGKLLVSLLKVASKDAERDRVCYELTFRWDASAEADLAKVLKNADEPTSLRQNAALALAEHGREDYRDVMLQWAAKADHKERIRWFNVLAGPVHKKRKGLDARVVCLGFQLIQAERNKHPDNIHGAYFLACTASSYVGTEFSPSTNDPKYKAQFGLNDRFFEDTVKNALGWWDRNREKYEKK